MKHEGKSEAVRNCVKGALFIEIPKDSKLKMQNCEDVCVIVEEKVKKQLKDSACVIGAGKDKAGFYDEKLKAVLKDAVVTASLRLYGVMQTNFMKFRRNAQARPARRKVHRDTLNSVISCVRKQTVKVFVIWTGMEKLWRIKLRTGFLGLLTPSLKFCRKFQALNLRVMHQCLVSILLYSISTKYSRQQYLKSVSYLSRALKKVEKRQLEFSFIQVKQSVVPVKPSRSYSVYFMVAALVTSILILFYL